MKKSILLIQPENKNINQFRKRQFNNFSQITMPYLAAFIDEKQYNITLIDEYHQDIPFDTFFDLVAITINTPNSIHCYQTSEKFRNKDIKVAFGGPHATLLPDEVIKHCDYIFVGECEDTWPIFLNDFYNNTTKKIYQTSKIPSLKEIPYPRWDLLKKRHNIMKGAIFASRGCPHSCNYCNLKQIYFPIYRTRTIEDVIEEISLLKTNFFVFWDDNFFGDKDFAKKLLIKLIFLKKKWAAQITILDCLDNELLSLAKQAGCLYFFIGIESFDKESLKDANKSINNSINYSTAINNLHNNNILIQAGLIFGFDSDDTNVFQKTLDFCETYGIDGVTTSILTPFPKTPIYETLKAENRLINYDWSYYDSKTKVAFYPKLMSDTELLDGYIEFREKFYSVSSFIKRSKVSKTRIFYNLIINLGYKLAIKKQ